MRDISFALNTIIKTKQCSPIHAFVLLSENEKEGEIDGLHKLQSKSQKKISGRLRNQSDF